MCTLRRGSLEMHVIAKLDCLQQAHAWFIRHEMRSCLIHKACDENKHEWEWVVRYYIYYNQTMKCMNKSWINMRLSSTGQRHCFTVMFKARWDVTCHIQPRPSSGPLYNTATGKYKYWLKTGTIMRSWVKGYALVHLRLCPRDWKIRTGVKKKFGCRRRLMNHASTQRECG